MLLSAMMRRCLLRDIYIIIYYIRLSARAAKHDDDFSAFREFPCAAESAFLTGDDMSFLVFAYHPSSTSFPEISAFQSTARQEASAIRLLI